ncbi:hypothetical protein D3C85_1441090 [compost metagenome]
MRLAEAGDLVHRLFGSLHQPGGLLLAKQALQGQILGRPGEQAAAIAAGGAAAAAIFLQHQDT